MGNKQTAEDSEPKGINFLSGKETNDSCFPKMSLKERIIGWAICSAAGWVISLFASISLFLSSGPAQFAIVYSIGQVINIMGSMFLSTPKGMWKDMTKKSRRITSLIYVLSIIATLVVALVTNIPALVLLFLVIQICAYYWYTISFIPYGQKLAKGIFKSCCLQ